MRILITGANGFIGQHLVRSLSEQGHQITACVRNTHSHTLSHPSIETMACDYSKDTQIDDWLPRLKNIDTVINAVGIIKETKNQTFDTLHRDTPIALFKACEKIKIKKVIQISALGADDTAFSQYHLSKKAADDFLMSLDLNWIIVMPSLVYGHNAKSMSLFTTMAALPITPVINNGNQEIQPIHINDVCTAISKLCNESSVTKIRIPFVGPEPLTIRELTGFLKKWLGFKKNRTINIPSIIALIVAWLLQFMPNSIISPESIKMLNKGNTSDDSLFVNIFGFTPISFMQSLIQYPARQADKWHAKLVVLRPLLNLSIAFVWIVTGIVSIFIYPIESSFNLLSQVGITYPYNYFALYTAAILDFIIGISILVNYRIKAIGIAQIFLILSYTLLITLFLTEQWAHPFGPIVKNIPLIASILIMISLEDR